MKSILILLFVPLWASAEIFQCTENGKTIFSDSPCGASAKVIHVEIPARSGSQLSNQKISALADEMYTERRKGELDRSISKQLGKIEKIETDYNKKRSRLETELTEHKAARSDYKWSGSSAKRDKFYKKKNVIRDEISQAKRKYRSDRRLAYLKLSQLREERRKF